jgi:predicted ATPase/DNA-binding SARP family transcriptional activator
MAQLTLRLFGPFQASLDGISITTFETHKVRALLAYLAVEADRPHSRDELIGLLWPDQPDQAARASLRQALANLRKALGDRTAESPFLSMAPDSIQFRRSGRCWIDVVAFADLIAACQAHRHRRLDACRTCATRLQQAADLYRGDFLAQFVQSGSVAFEEWVLLRRERWHRAALEALHALAEYHDRRGEYDREQHYAQRQLEFDPWREEAHRQLMHALALSGQRSAALAQYETCRRVLKEELGAEPTPETAALCVQIKAGSLKPQVTTCHLPVPSTPFIGREKELAELGALLENPACRLVTIVGPGGIGKTHLALAAATEQACAFDDGAAFVPLAALNSAEFMAPAILAALDLPLQGQREPQEQLLAHLHERELLLILDNIEHLLEGSALLSDIVRRAPGVTLLVTSRERLRLQAEWLFDLTELRYPADESVDAAAIREYGAVQLFAECARRTQRQFVLEDSDVGAVARICRIVQGMPLAIELAAAAVRRRSCAAIAAEIEASLRTLASGWRDAPERHRSVWAAFDHSWQLLTEEERSVFCQLSVFRGGFQEEAAAQVAGASPSLLSALVEKSLLRRDMTGRYDMHEVVRQYASEKLSEFAAAQSVRKSHLGFFLKAASEAELHLRSTEQKIWLDRLEAEHDNFRAALEWSLRHEDTEEAGLRLAGHLWWFWFLRGYWDEGRKWLAGSSRTPTASLRAEVLSGAGWLALFQGNYQSLASFSEENLASYRQLGDNRSVGTLLDNLGMAAEMQGDYERAKTLFADGLALRRDAADSPAIASSMLNLGRAHLFLGDYECATQLLGESLTLNQELGDEWNAAWSLMHLGLVALMQCQAERSQALFRESLLCFQAMSDSLGTNFAMLGLAAVAVMQDQPARAARLFGAAQVLSEVSHIHLAPGHSALAERFVTQTRGLLDAAAFDAAWAEGRSTTLEQAVAYALSG